MSLHDLSKGLFADRMRAFRAQQRGEIAVAPVSVEEAVATVLGPKHTAQRPKEMREPDPDEQAWAVVLSNYITIRNALASARNASAGFYMLPFEESYKGDRRREDEAQLLFVVSEDLDPRTVPYVNATAHHIDRTTPGRVALFYHTPGSMIDLGGEKPLFAYAACAHHDLLVRGNRPAPRDVVVHDSRQVGAYRPGSSAHAAATLVYSEGINAHYALHPYAARIALPTFVMKMQ